MRTQMRIVAGCLRGRKITCDVEPGLRPIPDRVRENLFNILQTEIADRPFIDLFAGTGVVGIEALSRGALPVTLVERDVRTAGEIVRHLHAFRAAENTRVQRADVYRWVEKWAAPAEPVTVFLGPPFPDFEQRLQLLVQATRDLQLKSAPNSLLIIQSDRSFDIDQLPDSVHWQHRVYGRNRLSFWRHNAGQEPVVEISENEAEQ